MALQNESLTTKTVRGVWWVGVGRVVRIGSYLVVNTVLANLLAPGDFGVLGMALVFTGFLDMFNDFGFGKALIQRGKVDQQTIESCLWANLGIGIGLAVLIVSLSPLAGQFYHNEQVPLVLSALALNFPIVALGIVQSAVLERNLSFRPLMIAEFTASVVAAASAIVLALLGGGVWSLVVWRLIESLIRTALIWIVSTFRPTFSFSWSSLREIMSFSVSLLGFNVVNYFARNTDNFLIGRLLGATPLGLYTMAYNIMLFPLGSLTQVLARVLFPALARRQSDLNAFRRGYLRAIASIALVSFPLMMGMFAVAPDFVPLVLGEEWTPIVPVVRVLVWVGMVQSVLSLNGSVYIALGHVGLRFRLAMLFSAVSVAGIAVGLSFGSIFTTAVGYALASALMIFPGAYIPLRLMQQPVRGFLATLAPIGLAGAGMTLGVLASHHWLSALNPYLGLAGQIILGVVLYIVFIAMLSKPTLVQVGELFLSSLQKFAPVR
jgi:PST family polysaccharide transporter